MATGNFYFVCTLGAKDHHLNPSMLFENSFINLLLTLLKLPFRQVIKSRDKVKKRDKASSFINLT